MDHNFKFTDQQTHDDQNASASARPKVPEKPKSLTYRQESTTKTPKDVTAAYGSNGPSLVKVFDTAASDELYDDINDEFGFFPKESSDTVTVTIKFSSADKAIVAETQKGESSAARPKEIRQRKKSPDSALVVRDAEKKTNNVLAVKSKHENTFGNSELVESSHNKHNDDAAADNLSFDINDYSVPSPIPPPRSKKNNRAQTLAAEDLLGVEPQHVTIIQNNSHASNGIVTETQKGESSAARPKEIRQRKKSTDSELVVLPIASAQPISRNTGSQYHTPEHQYTQKEKEHARNTISKKLKEVVSPKTSTKIVYDRSPISPVTSTPIELDRSGPADQDEGEDFMEYLKGLKADFSSSSSESEDNEHVLYARRQGDIGGSGENGFHLDDLQALLDDDDTIEAGEIQLPYTDETVDKEEYDTEPKIDQLEDTSKDIVNSDTDKHGSESENSDNDTEDDKSDDDDDDNGEDEDDEKEEDKEDDDDKDENTGDETSNDDDQYFDGQEDDGSDREGSFYDSSSESSDESNGDERFFGFTPGLRSRCNILARNMDETEDVQIPTEMKVINEFSSLLVEKILGNVISILSVTLSARSRNVAVDKQTYEIEPETNKFINAESNIMNIQQVSCESGRLITNAMGKANKSLNNQIDLKIANVKEMRNESIQTSQLSDSDNSMTSSKCYLVENIENFAYEHSKDSTGSFPKSCMSLSSDDNDLNCTVSALNQNEENPVNKIESGDNIDVFPDIDESTETEFESANDDESDDYWSVTLEHTLDSENNIENTDSNEFESSSEHECGSSDTCSSDCFTGENNQLPAVTIMPGISNDVSDTCPDKDVNGTETIKTSVTGFKCTPNIMKMTERVQRDNDTKIINEENIKLPLGASTIPAKEIDVDNAENSQTNPVDNGNCNKESTTSNESQADRNKTPFSDVSATEENSSCGDNSKGETRNMLNIRNYQIDLREDAIKDELQNISVSDQLFDEDLSTVFKEVNELIENMGHDSQSNNIKTQSKTQEMTDESNPKGKLQPIEKDDAVSSEKKKARAKRKDLHTITERDLPKIRTITYNVPYIIHETKTSLTPEERRQHMMLCQKKLSLLNGRKRNENAQRNKINRRRILKKGDFNGFDTDNEAKKNIPVSNLKTFKVGTGYIILEAGEVLNIPNGQNVNVARNGPDGCQGRPCKYFRG